MPKSTKPTVGPKGGTGTPPKHKQANPQLDKLEDRVAKLEAELESLADKIHQVEKMKQDKKKGEVDGWYDDEEEEDEEESIFRTDWFICSYAYYIRPGTKAAKGFRPNKPTLFVFRGELGSVRDDGQYVWQDENVKGCRKFSTLMDARAFISSMIDNLEEDEDWRRLGVPGEMAEEEGIVFPATIKYDSLGNVCSIKRGKEA